MLYLYLYYICIILYFDLRAMLMGTDLLLNEIFISGKVYWKINIFLNFLNVIFMFHLYLYYICICIIFVFVLYLYLYCVIFIYYMLYFYVIFCWINDALTNRKKLFFFAHWVKQMRNVIIYFRFVIPILLYYIFNYTVAWRTSARFSSRMYRTCVDDALT